jgi:hypothetical protein
VVADRELTVDSPPLVIGVRESQARPSQRVNEPFFSKTRDLLGKVHGLELIEIDRPDDRPRGA